MDRHTLLHPHIRGIFFSAALALALLLGVSAMPQTLWADPARTSPQSETDSGNAAAADSNEDGAETTGNPSGSEHQNTPQESEAEQDAPELTDLQKAQASQKTGLMVSGGETYYLKKGKLLKKSWKTIDKKTWYFSASGKALRGGAKKVGKKYWIFDTDGVLSTGKAAHILWIKPLRYLAQADGSAAAKGWHDVGKRRCHTSKKGILSTGIQKIGGHYYYFTKRGWLGTGKKNRIISANGKDYLVTKTGEMGKGWCEIDKYYCYCKANGRLLKNTVKDKIKINKKGYAKTRPMTPLEKKASSIVASITTSKMSKGERIAACWNYITSRSRFYYRVQDDPGAYTQSEFRRLALSILTINGGNCYGFAAGFAALTKAAGCDSYVIYGLCPGTRDGRADGLTRHGWVYISGYGYFDPEGQWAGFAYIYGSSSCPWVPHGRIAI